MGIMSMIGRISKTVEDASIIVEQAVGSTSTALYIGNEYITEHALEQSREAVLAACNGIGDPSKQVFIAICKSDILALGQVPTADVLRDYISSHADECVQLTPEAIQAIKDKYGKGNTKSVGLPSLTVLPAKAKKAK